VRDVVPHLVGGLRLHKHGVVLLLVGGEVAAEVGVHVLPPGLADVVEDAAGGEHRGEVLQLHLRALLQARPPPLEADERLRGHAPDLAHLLVEGVLRPRQVALRVGDQHPLRQRVARAAHHPRHRPSRRRRPLVQRRLAEHLLVAHGPRPPDADVGEGAVGADDALEGDGVGGLVVALRVAAVQVGGDGDLGGDDGDVRGVHGAHHPRDTRGGLEARLVGGGGGVVGPVEEARHEEVADGGADLEDELVAGGDAEAEALGDDAEWLPRGEAPDADGDALADGDGGAEGGVLLGDGGGERVAEEVEGGAGHAEGAAEVGLRVVGAAAQLPPRARPVLHPQPPLLVRRRRRRGVSVICLLVVVELEEGELVARWRWRWRGVVEGGEYVVDGRGVAGVVGLGLGFAALATPVGHHVYLLLLWRRRNRSIWRLNQIKSNHQMGKAMDSYKERNGGR
jgi:hypothetical protein